MTGGFEGQYTRHGDEDGRWLDGLRFQKGLRYRRERGNVETTDIISTLETTVGGRLKGL